MRLINPTSIEEAKGYACTYTSRTWTKEEIEQQILDSQKSLADHPSNDLAAFHKDRIESLSEWAKSTEFSEGDYHQSIDDLLFELVEWRAMFHAFQTIDSASNPFGTHIFFQQWKVGGAYAMYSQFSKLVSFHKQDRSLRKLWCDLQSFMEQEMSSEEVAYISQQVQEGAKRFSNIESKALAFRNKVIAHNEKNFDADLNHLDDDIRLIARIWSIITSWSCLNIFAPWRNAEQVFSGLEHFYNPDDLLRLKRARKEYLKKFEVWCSTNLITKHVESRNPFSSLSISWKSTTIG